MKQSDKFFTIFYILLGISIFFVLFFINSSLEKPDGTLNLAPIPLSNILITKVVEINTENFYKVLSDVDNYPRILPKNILSINKLEETNSSLVYEIEVIEKGITSTLLIKHDFFPFEKQILTVIEGDAKNTVIVQKFQNQGNFTKLTTDVEINLGGVLTGFGFLPQTNVNHAMNTILLGFIEYSIDKTQNEKIVDDLYREILKRPADKEGLSTFTSLLEQNKITPEDIGKKLYSSQEYLSITLSSNLKNIDELSDETIDTVNELYDIILRRDADHKGLQYFGSLLETKKFLKSDVRDELLKSSEFN
jgi:ribosome-associated toxin RatA of RatAB toxin-antitoxin module